jgi:hypothetical protein
VVLAELAHIPGAEVPGVCRAVTTQRKKVRWPRQAALADVGSGPGTAEIAAQGHILSTLLV